jgi:hypothetical protein
MIYNRTKIEIEEYLEITLKFFKDKVNQKTSYKLGKNRLSAIFHYNEIEIDFKCTGNPEISHMTVSVYKAHKLEIPLEVFEGSSEDTYKYLHSFVEVIEAILKHDPTGKIHEITTDKFPEFRASFIIPEDKIRRMTKHLSSDMQWEVEWKDISYIVDYGDLYSYTLKSKLNSDMKLPLASFRNQRSLNSKTTMHLDKLKRPEGMSLEDYITVCEFMARLLQTHDQQVIYNDSMLIYSNFHEEFLKESLANS